MKKLDEYSEHLLGMLANMIDEDLIEVTLLDGGLIRAVNTYEENGKIGITVKADDIKEKISLMPFQWQWKCPVCDETVKTCIGPDSSNMRLFNKCNAIVEVDK